MKKINFQNQKPPLISLQRGFALLYTVVVISLILTIAISISNVSYKQDILSSLARDSQIAFYQADAGVECGLYYDAALSAFPLGSSYGNIQSTYPSITCGSRTLELQTPPESDADYFVYEDENPGDATQPCFLIVFDKVSDPASSIIESRGKNTCTSGPRQVERAVRVTY